MRILVFALSAVALMPAAFAQDALKVDFVPLAQQGQTPPHLVVHAREDLGRLTLKLRGSHGKSVKLVRQGVKAGSSARFELKHPQAGFIEWNGELVAVIADQTASMPLKLSTQVLAPIKLTVTPQDVDLKKRTLKVRSNRPIKKAQVTLTSDLGHPLGTTETEVDGDTFELTWDPVEGRILQMSVQAYDEHDFFGGVDLFPWRIDIPHEDVQFASGKHEIQATEEPKLTASLAQLQDALKKYGRFAKVILFVAGHTDTVSDAQSNQQLSERRARAIARWFKKHGVRVPIRYAGFGESHLAVKTEDNIDEVRNRRAEYIVAVESPTVGGQPARWKPL